MQTTSDLFFDLMIGRRRAERGRLTGGQREIERGVRGASSLVAMATEVML